MLLNNLPQPSEKRIAIHIKPAAERALKNGHPWLFDQAIVKQSHEGQPGDLAVIFDKNRRFLAIGLYDPDSPIRVKILQHHQQAQINADWFEAKLAAAAKIREPLKHTQTNGYRLVYGENDGLPGLIVDRYADTLVVKLYTAAWMPYLNTILPLLLHIQPSERIVLRLSRLVQGRTPLHDGQIVYGPPLTAPLIVIENGLQFYADVINGHKTGFFFDHRDNRATVGQLANEPTGGHTVLDVFAYSGAFSVYAAKGGAKSVLSLDISAPALADAQQNFHLNHITTPHEVMVADAFTGLQQLAAQNRRFSMVIVDPPSFAKSGEEADKALSAYRQLTRLALNLLQPGGVFVMASCSSRVSEDAFYHAVLSAAGAGHHLEEIKRTSHALDHPVRFAEGAYLKCFFARKT